MSALNRVLMIVLLFFFLLVGLRFLKKDNKKSVDVKNIEKAGFQKNNLESQENDGGNVIVTVKPKVLQVGKKPVFELEFETHSVELDFDVAKQSSLTDDKGKKLIDAIWDGSPPGGHHRQGTLSFDNILTQTTYVELIIKDVSGAAERKFKWNL